MNDAQKQESLKKIKDLFEKHGHYYVQTVPLYDHSIQAGLLAEKEGYKSEVIVAALLHDISHLVGNDENLEGVIDNLLTIKHEYVSAEFLRRLGLNELTCKIVENHVLSLRFLVGSKEGFYESLTEKSKFTFKIEGGFLSEEEAKVFRDDPNFEYYCKIGIWDNDSKVIGMEIPKLDYFDKYILEALK